MVGIVCWDCLLRFCVREYQQGPRDRIDAAQQQQKQPRLQRMGTPPPPTQKAGADASASDDDCDRHRIQIMGRTKIILA